jgi:hypothetical protein
MSIPNHFKDQLLIQLRQVVSENPAPDSASRGRGSRLAGSRLALSGAGVAVAGAAAAAIVIFSSGSVTPSAFAVNTQSNGSVTVHVRSLSDAAGLQSSLRAAGVPALVNYAPAGKLPACPAPKGPVVTHQSGTSESGTKVEGAVGADSGPAFSTGGNAPAGALPKPPPGATVMSGSVQVTPDGVTFTVDPGSIKSDEQLVVTTSEGTLSSIGMAVVDRSVGACSAAPSGAAPPSAP